MITTGSTGAGPRTFARAARITTLALIPLCSAPHAVAGALQIEIIEVVRSGMEPPNRPGEAFTTFSDPSINNGGDITFKGNFDGPLSGNEGIYLYDAGGLSRIVDDSFDFNPPGQGGATSWTSFGPSVINDNTQILTRGNFSFGDNSQGLYVLTSGGGQVIFDDSPLQPVPGQPDAVGFSTFPMSAGLLPLTNDAGTGVTVARFVDELHVQRDGIYIGSASRGIERIADVTTSPPGQVTALYSVFDWFMVLNGVGDAAFQANYTGGLGASGVYRFDGGSSTLLAVADGRTQVPGQPLGTRFSAVATFPSMNDAGIVALTGTYSGVGGRGIFTGDGVGALTTVINDSGGFPVPGNPTMNWQNFGAPVINGPGQVVFIGEYGAAISQRGIYTVTDGVIGTVVDFSDAVPGQPGATFFAAGSVIINTSGHVAFTARYSGGSGDEGVYLYDGAALHRVVDESQDVAGQTVTNFHMMLGLGGSGGEDGKPRTLNESDQIAFRATLAGGGEGIYRVDISLPCATDLDGNGATDVDDLVMVIVTWGPCPPSTCGGDINSDGMVDVDDLVAVILAWGACQ